MKLVKLIYCIVFLPLIVQATELENFLPETQSNEKDKKVIEKLKDKKSKVFYQKQDNLGLPPKVEIIFDGSGSMGQMLSDKKSKMYVSKEILKNYLKEQWQEKALVGLRVYGSQRKKDCNDTKLMINFQEKSIYKIENKIKNLGPLGMTPLHKSIKKAVEDLKGYGGPKRVVILTDGEDTCGGDPCKTAEFLKQHPEMNLKFYTIGIGFAGGNFNLKSMNCLGPVLSADNEEELKEGLERVDQDIFSEFKNLQVISPGETSKVRVYQMQEGKKVLIRTFPANEKIRLEPGVYSAEVNLDPKFVFKSFKIKKNRRTILKVNGKGLIKAKYYDELLTVDVIDVHGKVVKSAPSNKNIIMPMGQYEVRIYHNPFYEYKIPSFFLNPNEKKIYNITDGTSYRFKNKKLKGFHVYKGTNELLGKYITNAPGVIKKGVYRFYLDKDCDIEKVRFKSEDEYKDIYCSMQTNDKKTD